ncbi:peptidylarginine deiminase [Cordyceps javanica]|uniref:Peptidylarginine deiminase n=1 Tax=Cordyceps javanica TaxID=43265 RepID=A0A545UVV3_9HYPO|nr:peptidylarginine deiminase [Cordyceps javanica]
MRLAALTGVFTLSLALPGPRPNPLTVHSKRASDLEVVLLADTNRDGEINELDRFGKETWKAGSGALFLANIADTDRRCSSQITGECAKKVGDIFRENFVESPEPTLLGKSWQEWNDERFVLQDAQDQNGLEKLDAFLSGPEADSYMIEHFKWSWAKSDDALLSLCHDASDNLLRNPALLAPLRTLPNPGLSADAVGSISVSNEAAASNVRIFHKRGDSWVYVDPDYTFSASDIKAGLELGLDGRDVRRPDGWDGRALITFTVRDGERTATDSVQLRVAPVLTHHHDQLAKQLYVSSNGQVNQKQFVEDLQILASKTGMESPMYVFDQRECKLEYYPDIWTQDFFEPGYMSIPGANGPVSLRVMIRPSQYNRPTGRKLFQELRSSEIGVVQHFVTGTESGTAESMGNLETIPPYTHNGKAYPAGRAIMGVHKKKKPAMLAFLEAQDVQQPLQLDTSWLEVGHIDEFLQFLPANSKRKWAMVVNDPKAGLELLQKAEQAGHGAMPAVSRPGISSGPATKFCTPIHTIEQVLQRKDFLAYQESCANAIQQNIDLIKQETGITDAEIIRLPVLYYPVAMCENKSRLSGRYQPRTKESPVNQETAGVIEQLDRIPGSIDDALPDELLPREENLWPVSTLYYNIINGIVLLDRKVVAPNPWGPVIDGKDILVEATNAAYAKVNFTIEYIDDWHLYNGGGGPHCATNTLREMTAQWW